MTDKETLLRLLKKCGIKQTDNKPHSGQVRITDRELIVNIDGIYEDIVFKFKGGDEIQEMYSGWSLG